MKVRVLDIIKFIEFTQESFSEPRENYRLEYKASQSQLPKNIWDTYSSFANTDGGLIVLGVEEIKGGKGYKVVGIDNPEKIITEFWNSVHDKNKISANLLCEDDVWQAKVGDKQIIQIRIPKATFEKRPIYLNNNKTKTYIRTDDGDRIASDDQFKYLIVDSQTDIDSELLDNYGLDDLNNETIEDYRKLLNENTNEQKYIEMDQFQLLCSIGVFRKDRQVNGAPYKLTVGGLLFFGTYNAITDRFKKFQLDYFKKNSSLETDWLDRVSSGDMNYPEINIFSFYNTVLKKLELSIPDKYVQTDKMNRGSFKSDLFLALKEALVNSLMHAYFDSDKVIKITDFEDYIEFYNPGEMKVSKEEFIHGSYSVTRNSIISTLFRRVGIAEKAGSGGPRIVDSATKNHLRFPEVVTKFESTMVRIWKIDMFESLKGLTDLEKTIVQHAMEKGSVKIKEIVAMTTYTDYKVRNTIIDLVRKEILIEVGNGKSRAYLISLSEETGMIAIKRSLKRMEDDFVNGK